MEKNDLIVKHNSLIRSRYDYTLAELRLVITIASMIEAEDEDFREYAVPAKEYAELMKADAHNVRKAVKELGKMLLSKPLEIPRQNGGFAVANWFSWYEYEDGLIKCSFHPKLKPYLLQLKEQFTKYRLENILKFKSVYSIRMYELAKSWEARGEFAISVEDLRKMFGLEGKYKLYADLKRKVIERSLKEINKLSDIELSYKEKKLGRKVTDLVFTVKPRHKEGEADHLATRRAFIAYVRRHYKPDPDRGIFPPIIRTKNGTLKIDNDGKLYIASAPGTLPGTLDHVQSDKLWSWLYEGVKNGEFELIDPPKSTTEESKKNLDK